jgi:hypothetical protein
MNKMKKIIILSLVCGFAGLFATSCVKDKGNYDYKDVTDIYDVTIDGLGDGSATVRLGDQLKRVPLLLGNLDGAEYWWFLIPMGNESTDERITLSRGSSPVLDVTLESKMGDNTKLVTARLYKLYLEISKDGFILTSPRPQDLFVQATDAALDLAWFILKDHNGEADFDYWVPETPSKAEVYKPDMLYNSGLARVVGNPVDIGYMTTFVMEYPDPAFPDDPSKSQVKVWNRAANATVQPGWIDMGAETGGSYGALALITDQNINAYDILNFGKNGGGDIAHTNDMFYGDGEGLNASTRFQNFTTTIWSGKWDYAPWASGMPYNAAWLMRDNQLWCISQEAGRPASLSRFPTMAFMPDGSTTYRLHPEFLRGHGSPGTVIVFDEISRSFLRLYRPQDRSFGYFPSVTADNSAWGGIASNNPDDDKLPELRGMAYNLVTVANDQYSHGPNNSANHPVALMRGNGLNSQFESGFRGSLTSDPNFPTASSEEYLLMLPNRESPKLFLPGTMNNVNPTYPFAEAHKIPVGGNYHIKEEGAKLHLPGGIDLNLWVWAPSTPNVFYQYNTQDDVETVALRLPANEEIVYFCQYMPDSYEPYSIRQIILSNEVGGQRYHLRLYDAGVAYEGGGARWIAPVEWGQPDRLPLKHFIGEGKASSVIVTESTTWAQFFN